MSNYSTTPTGKTPTVIVAAVVLCALGIAGALAAILFAFSGPSTSHSAATPPPQQTAAPANDNGGSNPQPANHPHTTSPVNTLPNQELPAAQVETIQHELGQLNYYEGPVNGVMNTQTVQAIKYLQRDSDLPQNGYYDQNTYLAF